MYFNRGDPECLRNAHYRYIRHLLYMLGLSTSLFLLLRLLSTLSGNPTRRIAGVLSVPAFCSSVFYGFRFSLEIYFTFLMSRDVSVYTHPPSQYTLPISDRLLRLFQACRVTLPISGEGEPRELNKENSFYRRRSVEHSGRSERSGSSSLNGSGIFSEWEGSRGVDQMWQSLGFDLAQRRRLGKTVRCFLSVQVLAPFLAAVREGTFNHVFSCRGFVNYALDFPADREYFLGRVERMARDPHMFDFVWDGGADYRGFGWGETSLPTDSAIVFHLFCRFMDMAVTPFCALSNAGERFSERYVRLSPRVGECEGVVLQQVRMRPPSYCVVAGGGLYETDGGSDNLFETVGLFFVLVGRNLGGWIGTKSLADVIGAEAAGILR